MYVCISCNNLLSIHVHLIQEVDREVVYNTVTHKIKYAILCL